VHLKIPLALSLALLVGTAHAAPQAKSNRRGSTSSRKKPANTKKTPPPAEEPKEQPAPVEAQAPEPSPAQDPKPAPTPAVQQAPVLASSVAVFAVPAERGTSREDAQRFESELREQLGSRAGVQIADLTALFPPPPPANLRQGDTLFEEGKTLYDNLDPEAAAKKFTDAAAFYRRNAADAPPERLGRVYIFLGASRLLNGDNTGAQEAFMQAALAAPGLQPDAKLFGQDVQDLFATARQELSKKERGTLSIDSVPGGAQVRVQGRALGTTPVKDVALAPGTHQVILTLPGYVPYGTFHEVPAGDSTELRPSLEPTPGMASVLKTVDQAATPRSLEARTPPPEALELAEQVGARYVVLASVKKDAKGRVSAVLHAWDADTKNRLRGLELRPDDTRSRQQALDQLHDFVTGKLVHTASAPFVMPEVLQKPWFWGVVGGVAVATTAGVLLATQPLGSKPPLGPRIGMPGTGW
jgi:hypothetical protein